jgi:hypothetical protein
LDDRLFVFAVGARGDLDFGAASPPSGAQRSSSQCCHQVQLGRTFGQTQSYVAHQRILARLEHEHGGGAADMYSQQHERVYHAQDKERKYKSERNMYLAGFSLTLLFVIGRILKLMQESVELEEEKDRVKTFVDDSNKKEVEAKSAEAKQANTTTSTTDKKKD